MWCGMGAVGVVVWYGIGAVGSGGVVWYRCCWFCVWVVARSLWSGCFVWFWCVCELPSCMVYVLSLCNVCMSLSHALDTVVDTKHLLLLKL